METVLETYGQRVGNDVNRIDKIRNIYLTVVKCMLARLHSYPMHLSAYKYMVISALYLHVDFSDDS